MIIWRAPIAVDTAFGPAVSLPTIPHTMRIIQVEQ